MLEAIIIEDEKAALNHLLNALASLPFDVHVKATLGSVSEGTTYLSNEPKADIIFSDVQLTDGLSFEIFSETKTRIPVVFVTGYDQFITNAFEYNSIDYLLKPVDKDDLARALVKYQALEKHFIEYSARTLEQFTKSLVQRRRNRIMVRKGMEHISLRLSDVVLFYTENKIAFAMDKQGRKYLCENNLTDIESELDPNNFFRANRQYIINIDFVKSYKAYEKVKLQIDLSIADLDHFIVVSQETAPQFRKWINEN